MQSKPVIPKYVLEELEKAFPEVVNTQDTNELLVNAGKRTVVHYVRSLIKQQETKVHARELT